MKEQDAKKTFLKKRLTIGKRYPVLKIKQGYAETTITIIDDEKDIMDFKTKGLEVIYFKFEYQ